MIAWRPLAILLGCVLFLAALVVGAGMMTGADGLREMWREIRIYVIAGAAVTVLGMATVVAMVVQRLRARQRRDMARYELVLGQADEATHDEAAAAAEALVQALRSTLVERVAGGQPWLAIESWHVPSSTAGETGNALLMVLCEPTTLAPALAALRRAYPNLTVRCDLETGDPLRYEAPRFEAAHVLRVRKGRDWVLPVGGSTRKPRSLQCPIGDGNRDPPAAEGRRGRASSAACAGACCPPTSPSMRSPRDGCDASPRAPPIRTRRSAPTSSRRSAAAAARCASSSCNLPSSTGPAAPAATETYRRRAGCSSARRCRCAA